MSTDLILYSVENGIARVRFNRPEVLNSFNRTMSSQFLDALQKAESDDSVRVVVVSGEGRAFCAGQDLGEVEFEAGEISSTVRNILAEGFNPVVRKLRSIKKPVIAGVHGVAAGAGASMALACDLVLADREATFVQAFVRVGLIPDGGGTYYLPRLVGLARAKALAMLGDKITANEAFDMGLIYRVCEGDHFLNELTSTAERLRELPPRALSLIKEAFQSSLSNTLDEQLECEVELQQIAAGTDDFREGVTAFLEKRKPIFSGK